MRSKIRIMSRSGSGPEFACARVLEYFLLPVRLVNRHPGAVFQLPDGMNRLRPLAQQFHQLAVNLINFAVASLRCP